MGFVKALKEMANSLHFLLQKEGHGDLGSIVPPLVMKKFCLQFSMVERFSQIPITTFRRPTSVEYEAVVDASSGKTTMAIMPCTPE